MPAPVIADSVEETIKRLTLDSPQPLAAGLPVAEILTSLQRNPNNLFAVTRNGKPAAIVLTPRRYRELLNLLASILEEMENREWGEKAEKAKADGFISPEESEALMRKLG